MTLKPNGSRWLLSFAIANEREVLSVLPIHRNKKAPLLRCFFIGGEGEIRTLELCYQLRDFQSRALDQLGDFSVLLTTSIIIAQLKRKINT